MHGAKMVARLLVLGGDLRSNPRMRIRALLIIMTGLALAAPSSAEDCEVPSDARGARPAAEDGPTQIRIGMFLIDVIRVNDRDQSITVDFNVNLRWRDPRLVRDPDEPPLCIFGLHEIWQPNLRILNQRVLKPHFPQQLRVDRNGVVHYDQRFFGELRSIGDFSEFPFDTRNLTLELVAVDRRPGEVSWVKNVDRTGKAGLLAIANWRIGEQTMKSKTVNLLPGLPFAGVDFVFPMERHATYFVWNTIVPLVMIVFMSWGVFWVNPQHLGAQLGLAATSMLSLIAYRFTLGGVLPPIPYFTRMDLFLNGASLLVFLALVEAVAASTIADNGRQALASRIDRVSRVAFPLVFAGVVAAAFVR
jgi:hypothetical protein